MTEAMEKTLEIRDAILARTKAIRTEDGSVTICEGQNINQVNLNLKIYPIFKDTLRRQICQGDTVRVGKSKYFQTGAYLDILKSSTIKCMC